MFKKVILAAALVLAVGPAHAEARDSGVGKFIALQGNHALAAIKAEFTKVLAPVLPAKPAVVRAATPMAAIGGSAAVRCAP